MLQKRKADKLSFSYLNTRFPLVSIDHLEWRLSQVLCTCPVDKVRLGWVRNKIYGMLRQYIRLNCVSQGSK